jgi:hypothetical protein
MENNIKIDLRKIVFRDPDMIHLALESETCGISRRFLISKLYSYNVDNRIISEWW